MNISEIEDELFRLEYPNLMADHDPDIERYYYLRTTGQSPDALYIFESRLKPRYPDDEFRTALLRSYRSRHPSFRKLLSAGYRALGRRSLERIRLSIDYIAGKAESYNPRDVFSTIKAAEDILRILPRERYEAIDGIDRYARYAGALNIRARSLARAAGLVRAYLTQSLAVVEEERRRRETLEQQELRRERKRLVKLDWESYQWQKKYGSLPLIDFSSVVFSPADLLRIEIPRSLTRLEDQTLAYCIKYWNLTGDAAFERTLFLYSRKYGSRNHDVYMTIRRGKLAKQRDDEILASVLSSLVKGYYYSITGDRYLQQKWNMVKPLLTGAAPPGGMLPALPAPEQVSASPPAEVPDDAAKSAEKPAAKPKKSGKAARRPAAKKRAKRRKPGQRPERESAAARKKRRGEGPSVGAPRPATGRAVSSAVPQPAAVTGGGDAAVSAVPRSAASGTDAAVSAVSRPAAGGAVVSQAPRPAASGTGAAVGVVPRSAAGRAAARAVRAARAARRGDADGSVSNRLRELSGRSYDLYQERFLSHVRPAIRKVLGEGRGLFFRIPEEAENLIYDFLRDHYSDPFMDWAGSGERKTLGEMGFDLSSLNPIIDECYGKL